MTIELSDYIFAATDERENVMTIIVADTAECPYCHVQRACFVNRDGRTRCFWCDDVYKLSASYGLYKA